MLKIIVYSNKPGKEPVIFKLTKEYGKDIYYNEESPPDEVSRLAHRLYTYIYSWTHVAWPEAEPYIMKDPSCAYFYARYIIKRGWPEAEPYIAKNRKIAKFYRRYIRSLPDRRKR